jgi:hypothetical protein
MRFALCVLIAVLVPGSASAAAAKRTMSLSQAQAAAQKGDSKAAAAVATTTDQRTCQNECANRGYKATECTSACRPGICHPDADTPYCVGR